MVIRALDKPDANARYWACIAPGDGEVGTAKCLPAPENATPGNNVKVARAARDTIMTLKNRLR